VNPEEYYNRFRGSRHYRDSRVNGATSLTIDFTCPYGRHGSVCIIANGIVARAFIIHVQYLSPSCIIAKVLDDVTEIRYTYARTSNDQISVTAESVTEK